VIQIGNCPKHETIDGVEYLPVDGVSQVQGDVVIATTSGGELDLGPLRKLRLEYRLFIIWVHGIVKPGSLDDLPYRWLYAVSNFIGDLAADTWGVDRERLFVSYNGFEEDVFALAEQSHPARDPFRLVYFSHPSKGLSPATGVLRRLRQADSRYHLLVLGGPRLWGQAEVETPQEEGVEYRGLVGQQTLVRDLLTSQFSLNLQSREEPGALAIVDALRAGCVLIGSPVGCYPEMVRDGRDGFLIPGHADEAGTQERAAATIEAVAESSERLQRIRHSAQSIPWDTETLAQAWAGHWEWSLSEHSGDTIPAGSENGPSCPRCGSPRLRLADGYHCVVCGTYQREME
jgi:glycosyltransferase involved in cell wall biosynthesis